MPTFNFLCRKATLSDKPEKIAQYIHHTDPFIYPCICSDPLDKAWVEFINKCLNTKNCIFNIEHIAVVTDNDDIIGIACVIPCAKNLTFSEKIEIPKRLADNFRLVKQGYFEPLIEESLSYNGFNIVNICVDEKYRGKGAGSALISYCIDNYGSKTLHLDVIASNEPAVRLYKKFGFKIEMEYLGFSGDNTQLPCYHMIRKPH